jgi:FkbM family methyltransferase
LNEPIVDYNGLQFFHRPDTTDWNIIREACGGLNTKLFDVEKGEQWFDIGAHIGTFTCYAASKGAKVVSFEPSPDNFALLARNVALNGFENAVELHNKGVTKDGREVELFIDTMNFGNCSIHERDGAGSSIKVETLGSYFLDTYENYCLKVDTEGCEYEILSGIDVRRIKKLILEDHYWLETKEERAWLMDMLDNEFPVHGEHGGYMHYAWR